MMENTVDSTTQFFYRYLTGSDMEIHLSYRNDDTSSSARRCIVDVRRESSSAQLQLDIAPSSISLRQLYGGQWTYLETNSGIATTEGVWYDLRIVADGASVKVWRAARGEMPELVIDNADTDITGTSVRFAAWVMADADYAFDDIGIWSSSLSNTTTFECNEANELTKVYDPYGGETTFTYDGFGRMVTKALEENDTDTFSAVYTYGYGSMLTNVDTDIPGESDVSYAYGGDGMRRQRASGGVTTIYNWINDENANGDLITSYVHGPGLGKYLALLDGTNPATGTYSYFVREANGSPRILTNGTKDTLGVYAFTPYGQEMGFSGVSLEHLYTGHLWDPSAQMYPTFARYYDPRAARWTAREPEGLEGPNPYWYSSANPVSYVDPDGRGVVVVIGIGGAAGAVGNYLRGGVCSGDWWGKDAASNFVVGGVVGATATAAGLIASTTAVEGAIAGGALGFAAGIVGLFKSIGDEIADYRESGGEDPIEPDWWAPVSGAIGGAIGGGFGGLGGATAGGLLGSFAPCAGV